MYLPISLVISLTGWVYYRFRQTRAMTLAQFFEIRYSRGFRLFAGILCFVSGIINFGIFPSVGARFFIHFCDLPQQFTFWGFEVSTFVLTMLLLLGVSIIFTFLAGQITIITTDFLQGTFFNITSIILIVFLLGTFSWTQISEGLLISPPDESKINPFLTSGEKSFNIWFFLIGAFVIFYRVMAWQGSQAYNSSATSAHEAKMSGVVGQWRGYVLLLLLVLAPVCMYAMMHHPDFSAQAALVNQALDKSFAGNDQATLTLREQMLVPVALRTILPQGLMGMMCAVMLAAFISTHDTYLHSWASIFIQDVVMPFRKKPFEPARHIRVLRLAVIGVAVFIFFFSLLFPIKEYIQMFTAITGAIFVGGAGAVIIGGLYWKRGTTLGAYSGLITGAVLAVFGIIIRQVEPDFFINSKVLSFLAMIMAIAVYIIVSLFENKTINLDRLLNRGEYAVEGELQSVLMNNEHKYSWLIRQWHKLITSEFTKRDKIIYAMSLVWASGWFTVFLAGTVHNLFNDVSNQAWLSFWRVYVWVTFAAAVVVTIWMTCGGLINLRELFSTLRSRQDIASDDGWVETDDMKRGFEIQKSPGKNWSVCDLKSRDRQTRKNGEFSESKK